MRLTSFVCNRHVIFETWLTWWIEEGCQGITLGCFATIPFLEKVTTGLLWPFSYGPASDIAMVGVKRIARPYGSSSELKHWGQVKDLCFLFALETLDVAFCVYVSNITWDFSLRPLQIPKPLQCKGFEGRLFALCLWCDAPGHVAYNTRDLFCLTIAASILCSILGQKIFCELGGWYWFRNS